MASTYTRLRDWLSYGAKVAPADAPAPALSPASVLVEARDDDRGWRPLSQSKRDLSPITQARMQQLAHHAWEQHRVANRLIELPIAFILGDGVGIQVEDEEAQVWLDAWWRDPITSMDLTLEKRMRELALYGEQVVVTFTGTDGHVRHGALDPADIDKVILDPDNAALPIGIKVKTDPGVERIFRIILDGDDEALLMPAAIALRQGMTAGDCHYWRVNDLLTGTRGRSDLLSAIDLADAYTQLIFGEVERAASLRMAIWDVMIKGGTPDQVAARAAEISPPSPNSVRVHNDAEVWTSVSHKLEAADASETLRQVRNEVLGGATIPEHWYGGGGDVNRATAAEMDEPTYKVFRRRQLLWKAILEREARFVIRSRRKALGKPSGGDLDEALQPQAVFPEMQSVDVSRYAAALGQIVAAGAAAVNTGLLTRETAVSLIASIAGKFRVELDPAEELAKAQAEQETRSSEDLFRMPPEEPAADPAPAAGVVAPPPNDRQHAPAIGPGT